MRKLISAVSAAAFLAAMSATAVVPAAANGDRSNGEHYNQDQFIGNYCSRNPHANQCDDWRRNRGHWDDSHYRSFYRDHRHESDFAGNAVAALFGFAAGVAVGSAAQGNVSVNTGATYGGTYSDHVRACAATYRSYDARSDSFLGYDGVWHRCRI